MITEMKVTKFSSLEDFIRHTNECPKNEIRFDSWAGCKSYEHAVDIARKGVELERATTALKQLEHSRQEMVQVNDVTGSVVNMDAYLQGLPENMMEFPIVEEPTKFLNLLVEVGENSYVSSEQMVNKAIAIASVVDNLENNGYRISINVCDLNAFAKSYTTGRESFSHDCILATVVKIKDYHQSLSIGQLIGCCHPSFLRGLIFTHYYGIFKNVGGPPMGKGRNVMGDDAVTVVKSVSEGDTIYIPNSDTAGGSISTVESAIKMVEKFITL